MSSGPLRAPFAVISDPELAAPAVQAGLGRLRARIRSFGSAAVAFSGGVDSALVAKVAHDELADRAVAVTVVSPLLAAADLAFASEQAREIGIRHVSLPFRADEAVLANPADRCFHCKFDEYGAVRDEAARLGLAHVLDGTQADDARAGDRPGMRARDLRGVSSPLLDEGLSKRAVRAAAQALGLVSHDRPASPCLASRFPYGERITPERLRKVEAGEAFVRSLGFRDVRVRIRPKNGEDLARIELPFAEIESFRAGGGARQAEVELRRIGFSDVTVDPAGYRPNAPPVAR